MIDSLSDAEVLRTDHLHSERLAEKLHALPLIAQLITRPVKLSRDRSTIHKAGPIWPAISHLRIVWVSMMVIWEGPYSICLTAFAESNDPTQTLDVKGCIHSHRSLSFSTGFYRDVWVGHCECVIACVCVCVRACVCVRV